MENEGIDVQVSAEGVISSLQSQIAELTRDYAYKIAIREAQIMQMQQELKQTQNNVVEGG